MFYNKTWTDLSCGSPDGTWCSASKCQVVQVMTSRKVVHFSYTLHGHVLEVVSSARYLGVWCPYLDVILP